MENRFLGVFRRYRLDVPVASGWNLVKKSQVVNGLIDDCSKNDRQASSSSSMNI